LILLPYLVISYARSIAILTGLVVYQAASTRDHPAQSYITAFSYDTGVATSNGSKSGFSSSAVLSSTRDRDMRDERRRQSTMSMVK
jgi:hypothetical protein